MAVNYKLTIGGVIRLPDYVSIPENGAGWSEYLDWVALGNAPEAADVIPPDAIEPTRLGAKQWLIDNPTTQQLFTLTIPELETEINTLVDVLFPLATAGNRTKTKKLWMALAVSVRFLVKRELS